LNWSEEGCFRSGAVRRVSCPAKVGSRKESRIASAFAAYWLGVKGAGDTLTKLSGLAASLQRSYRVMFWKISS
jgi:hypothetical protein